MVKNYQFTNPSLQKIDSDAESIISNHIHRLDSISNDINALEERLQIAGIPFNFVYVLSEESRKFSKSILSHQPMILYGDDFIEHEVSIIEYVDHCLVWGKNEDGKFRLSHIVYATENELIKYSGDDEKVYERESEDGEPKISTSTPLIQTKSQLRLKLEKELPIFYKMIIEALKTKVDQEYIVKYSPNYNSIFPAKIDLIAKSITALSNEEEDLPF